MLDSVTGIDDNGIRSCLKTNPTSSTRSFRAMLSNYYVHDIASTQKGIPELNPGLPGHGAGGNIGRPENPDPVKPVGPELNPGLPGTPPTGNIGLPDDQDTAKPVGPELNPGLPGNDYLDRQAKAYMTSSYLFASENDRLIGGFDLYG